MFVSIANAQTASGGGGFDPLQLLPLVLIFVVFYFLLIRPQQKKAKAHREMVAQVKRGDKVLTGGGIYGKVVKVVDEHSVQIEISDGVKVHVARPTITTVVDKGDTSYNEKDQTKQNEKK
ncbi:MAG: preprotein translocase subunit YajC [Rhodospirillaceae bacterium]|mgnify:FL=1|nr:preprotein translocase subunit YajC [Rhodospirillaceae bacterium]|tara:strand:+ start:777 stop:1136 length:360 start_codon:yes stop_codon:yes gene_type:complete